jgi:hypothetical protein
MKDETLKLGLEVLEALETIANAMPFPVGKSAITAIQQALAAQPAVQEPVKWSDYEPDGRRYPAVPDAIHHTDNSESPEYRTGWNDCRAEMLKGMKP